MPLSPNWSRPAKMKKLLKLTARNLTARRWYRYLVSKMTHYRRSRNRYLWLITVTMVLLLALLLGQKAGWVNKASQNIQQNQPGLYKIAYFVDGDTIAVDMNGKVEKV